MLGKNRGQLRVLNSDLDSYAVLGKRISSTRSDVRATIPAYVAKSCATASILICMCAASPTPSSPVNSGSRRSLITAGARLMLALLDHCASELHGTYVMEDTDSMAIVATEHGGFVPCPGGPFEMPDGHAAIRALSWKEIDETGARFRRLNPYTDKSRSILKIERDNYDPETGKQQQVTASATPLLAIVPLTQPCTSEVMSISKN